MARWRSLLPESFPGLRAVAGLLLLAAAALKLHAATHDPSSGVPGTLLLVEFEILLGCWPMSGVYARVSRVAALACFAIFLAVSVSLALSGAPSCGCFGRVSVNPWGTAALDFAILVQFLFSEAGLPRIRSSDGNGHAGYPLWFTFLPAMHRPTRRQRLLRRRAGAGLRQPNGELRLLQWDVV